jgi:sirohydrochlorin cobaltochelatase
MYARTRHLFSAGILACLGLLALWAWPPAARAGDAPSPPGKPAILLVSFGTSVESAQTVYAKIEAATKARFPGVEVRWAFTSKKIRHKLAAQGQVRLSPIQALANLAEDGYERVAVQSLHIIPGEEFEGLKDTAARFAGMPKGLKRVELGMPLLNSGEDRQRAAKAMLAHAPQGRMPEQALVFMGHGTSHAANAIYGDMASLLQKLDANAFLATVEGSPGLDAVRNELRARGVKQAWLIPFMSVAGDHALSDMAGKYEGSWVSRLGEAGIAAQPVLLGMAEHPEIVAIWLDHLHTALERLDK